MTQNYSFKKLKKIGPILEEVKDILIALYQDKLIDIILYGSYARGEEREESDIDIAVIINDTIQPYKEVSRITDKIYDLELKRGKVISIYPISKVKYNSRSSPFLINLQEEGISLCQV